MAIQLITTSTRPSKDVPWTNTPDGLGWYANDTYYKENWQNSGRILSITNTFSDDGLSVTSIREFSDWQALDDFISDVNLTDVRLKRNSYSEQVGIDTINIETKEV